MAIFHQSISPLCSTITGVRPRSNSGNRDIAVLWVKDVFDYWDYNTIAITKKTEDSYSDEYNLFVRGLFLLFPIVRDSDIRPQLDIVSLIDPIGIEHTRKRLDSVFVNHILPIQHYLFTQGCSFTFPIAKDAVTILGGLYYFAAQMEFLLKRKYTTLLLLDLVEHFDTLVKSGSLLDVYDEACRMKFDMNECFRSGLSWYRSDRIFGKDRDFMNSFLDVLRKYANAVYADALEYQNDNKIKKYRYTEEDWWIPEEQQWVRSNRGNFDHFLTSIYENREKIKTNVMKYWPIEFVDLAGKETTIYSKLLEFLFYRNLILRSNLDSHNVHNWSRSIYQLVFITKAMKYVAHLQPVHSLVNPWTSYWKRKRPSTSRKVWRKKSA